MYPENAGLQGKGMTFINSNNTYPENKIPALGQKYFFFLPRNTYLRNKRCYLCPHTLIWLLCLRPS